MVDSNSEIVELLKGIRDLLVPVSAYYEDQYREILERQSEVRFRELETLLTAQRRLIFPLLFDSRRLSQAQIAKEANTTQPTVSRFINALLERDLIDQVRDETGTVTYKDKFNLAKRMEDANERGR